MIKSFATLLRSRKPSIQSLVKFRSIKTLLYAKCFKIDYFRNFNQQTLK